MQLGLTQELINNSNRMIQTVTKVHACKTNYLNWLDEYFDWLIVNFELHKKLHT